MAVVYLPVVPPRRLYRIIFHRQIAYDFYFQVKISIFARQIITITADKNPYSGIENLIENGIKFLQFSGQILG